MNFTTPRERWQDYCRVVPDIQARHGVSAALEYVVGEKLMMFAQTAETEEGFRVELPAFCQTIRELFTKDALEGYFEAAEKDSRVESDLFRGADAEEADELREILEDAKRDRERRSWVKAMLLRSGS
jgi:hypothetical protein